MHHGSIPAWATAVRGGRESSQPQAQPRWAAPCLSHRQCLRIATSWCARYGPPLFNTSRLYPGPCDWAAGPPRRRPAPGRVRVCYLNSSCQAVSDRGRARRCGRRLVVLLEVRPGPARVPPSSRVLLTSIPSLAQAEWLAAGSGRVALWLPCRRPCRLPLTVAPAAAAAAAAAGVLGRRTAGQSCGTAFRGIWKVGANTLRYLS